MPLPQAGPSIEDAAKLLSSVAQPLFLTLHSQHSDSLHDSQDQQADSQQPPQHSNVFQAVTGNGSSNGNGISIHGHSHDIVSSRTSDGYSSSSSSSNSSSSIQNPHGESTQPYSPEGFTSDAQDLQVQVWECKPCGVYLASPGLSCGFQLENVQSQKTQSAVFDMRLKVLRTAALYRTTCHIWLPVWGWIALTMSAVCTFFKSTPKISN